MPMLAAGSTKREAVLALGPVDVDRDRRVAEVAHVGVELQAPPADAPRGRTTSSIGWNGRTSTEAVARASSGCAIALATTTDS